MPKLTIGKENFQEVDAYTGNVYLRYRIVSEDRNRSSYWSPVFTVVPPVYYIQGDLDIPGNVIATKNSGYITLAWDSVHIHGNEEYELESWGTLPSYDIWIQYGGNNMVNAGPWFYKERVFTTSVNLVTPPTYTYIDSNGDAQQGSTRQAKIEIHRSAKPLIRYTPDRISFAQQSKNVNLTNNTIGLDENHKLETGDSILYRVYNASSAISPLSGGTGYFVRKISDTEISLYPTQLDAINNTNVIDFASYGQGDGLIIRNSFLQSASINPPTDIITLPFEHNYDVGQAIVYNAGSLSTPLVAETLYFARPVDSTSLTLHLSRAGAIQNTGKIDITTVGSGYATLSRYTTLLYKTAVANLSV